MRCSLELPDEKRQAVGSFCCGQASGLHIPLEEAQRSYFCRWARRQENEGLCRDSKSSGEMTAKPVVGYNHCHSPPAVRTGTVWPRPKEKAGQCGGLVGLES
ncbi:hypothetical protein VULLAG_LOCUS13934 [Vulpes lagopus]